VFWFVSVDGSSAGSGSDNDTVLIAVVRMMRESSLAERSLLEPSKDEYVTRHLIDGRIIYSDHRYDICVVLRCSMEYPKCIFLSDTKCTVVQVRT